MTTLGDSTISSDGVSSTANGNFFVTNNVIVQNSMNLNGNQLWTNTGTLYLNYSNTNNGAVQIGIDSSTEHDLNLPFGNINMSGNINLNGNNITNIFGGVGIGWVNTGWFSDGNNLAARPAGAAGDFYVQSPAGATTYMLSGAGVGGTRFASGNVHVDNNIYASAFLYNSDERLKKNIQSLTNNLDKVLSIKPVTYYWKDTGRGAGLQIGFIAQNVQTVAPEIVHADASTTLLSVDYVRMTPLLVGAVQELNQKIIAQQSQIDAQQQEINDLKSAIKSLQMK